MTNVDFFRAFCTSKSYYFEHSRQELDFSNLFDGKAGFTTFMFHFTEDIKPNITGTNFVKDKVFSGTFLILKQSSPDQTIDVQRSGDSGDGKYELYVKPLIDAIIEDISSYNRCSASPVNFTVLGMKEIYNFFDFNGDGLWVRYQMEI